MQKSKFLPRGRKDRTMVLVDIRETKSAKAADIFLQLRPGRDFEFITISADEPGKKDKALKFLEKQEASNTNYLFSVEDKYKLIESLDPDWQGGLPYTILVEPGGKIVYRNDGIIDEAELKKVIVDNKYIGRYY